MTGQTVDTDRCRAGDVVDPPSVKIPQTQPGSDGGSSSSTPPEVRSQTQSAAGGVVVLDPADAMPQTHRSLAGSTLRAGGNGATPPTPTIHQANPGAVSDGWGVLRALSEMFYDAQQTRIALTNRIGSETVWPEPVTEAIDAARLAETNLGKAMRQSFRETAPHIHQWVIDTPGVGEHLMARLLGAIGDPRIALPHHWEGEGTDRVLIEDEPYERTVSQLWAYCGIGDPTRKRRKGMTPEEAAALGNPRAKMICRLLAESAMKAAGPTENAPTRRRSPYRDVYDIARENYQTNRDWTDGHCHNAALRKTAKAIVRDLWVAAATLHDKSAKSHEVGEVAA